MQTQFPWVARAPRAGLAAPPPAATAAAIAAARRRLAAPPPQRHQQRQWQQQQPQQHGQQQQLQRQQQQGQHVARLQPCRSVFDQAWGASVDLQTLWDTLPQNLFAASLLPCEFAHNTESLFLAA